MNMRVQLVEDLHHAEKALAKYDSQPLLGNYYIGFFDRMEQLNLVWAICKRDKLPMARNVFNYKDVKDWDYSYWQEAVFNGLFPIFLENPLTDEIIGTLVGFRCCADPDDDSFEIITPQAFLKKYGSLK